MRKRIKCHFSIYLTIMVGLAMLSVSCQSNVSSMSETVVSRSAKILRDTATPTGNIAREENIILLGDSAAVFFLNIAEDIQEKILVDISGYLNEKVTQIAFYDPVQQSSELNSYFKKNSSLNQLKDIYLESLARVSVSNKDISNRIGKELKVDNLVVYQIDRWPCDGCSAPLRIRIKMRVIDASSGLIIWTGINEIVVDQPDDATYDQLLALSVELLDQFKKRFQRKWHRKRFQNLSLLAKK